MLKIVVTSVFVDDQEASRSHHLELAARILAGSERGAKALSQRLIGRRLERTHHGHGHLRRAHHVGDRHAVPPRGTGMDRANVVPGVVRGVSVGIDHRQLPPAMMGRGRYQCVDRLLG